MDARDTALVAAPACTTLDREGHVRLDDAPGVTSAHASRSAGTPRLQTLAGPPARQLIAGLCVVLATIVLLPIPFGNIPPAWAISIMTLGMLRRDGLWILIGIATGFASIALVWGVAVSLVGGVVESLQRILG
jgi:hypothetical protein